WAMTSTGYRWPWYDGDADDTSEPLPGTTNSKIIPGRSANVTTPIRRFGEYSTHEIGIQPGPYDPHLDVDFSPLRGDGPPAPDDYGQAA
ncbi:hypothetical protein ACFZAG_35960, partial [Streptomyces sp. NPDC012403]|uniref:hypothetical protein n=1 Tax=Streptomyces sp. NPDC012403 TaxID=3364831 RepID=UPI0036EC43D7